MHDSIIQIVNKYDEALNAADSKKYRLSIQLSQDGFSFCIFHDESQKFLSIESVSFADRIRPGEDCDFLRKYYSESKWLKLDFKSLNILYESKKTTLIPSPLYDESEKETYSTFNFNLDKGHVLKSEKLVMLDAFILYTVPKDILDTLNHLFPNYTLMSHTGRLIEGLIISNKNLQNQKRAFVNVRNSHLDLVFLEGSKLHYCNSFPYKSKEDFIYYVIFVMEQLGLNPEEIELRLSGFIDKNSMLFELIYKYVRNIDFQKPSESFNYSYIFNEVPLHYYFNLLNHGLCE
jgi:hypothetical protein